MSEKKTGLGRGLDALLMSRGGAAAFDVQPTTIPNNEIMKLPIDRIQRGSFQPRMEIKQEALQELAESIRNQGVVQPIVVRPKVGTDSYEIIAGERRWRASQIAGLREIPVVIKQVPDHTAMCIALIENIQREDLNPLEEATAFSRLIHEFGLTHQEVATAVGRSRTAVTNLLRLLELSAPVKELLEAGSLEMGHARALLSLSESQQVEAAQKTVRDAMTVRETEQLVRKILTPKEVKAYKEDAKDPNIQRLEEELSLKLGANVQVQHSNKGKGSLVIHYNSLEELDGIIAHIK